jgi:hypothetical protein
MTLPVKAHAALGASSADRWMHCPGSVALTAGLPDVGSEHSREGTAAHALAEMALTRRVEPEVWLDTEIEGVKVTDDMVDAVSVYVRECRAMMRDASQFWIERKFDLNSLHPPAPMFGTGDFAAWWKDERRLRIVDYKHGQGHVVEVRGNPQLRYYALGLLLAVEADIGPGQIDDVVITIVQPRAAHPDGIVRSETLSYAELLAFQGELLYRADQTVQPDAPLVPGRWCRFCKALPRCPAQLAQAQAAAMTEFSAEALPVLPDPRNLPLPVLLRALENADLVEDFFKAVRSHVQARLEQGEDVPGWKLVAKRATRKWTSEADTRRWLTEQGYTGDEIEETALKSPAQIEKLVGKKAFPTELTVKQSSGFTLAPAHDARPALPAGAHQDFAFTPTPDTKAIA